MAEQEVIKHTKRIFGIWKTQNTLLHKLSEFVGEILIIVFAITLSIYVHDLSELQHQRREAKGFSRASISTPTPKRRGSVAGRPVSSSACFMASRAASLLSP